MCNKLSDTLSAVPPIMSVVLTLSSIEAVLVPFSTSMFVALQIVARDRQPLVFHEVALQKLKHYNRSQSLFQQCHKSDAPQLAIRRRLRCSFHEHIQSRHFFEQSTSQWSAVHSEGVYLYIMNHKFDTELSYVGLTVYIVRCCGGKHRDSLSTV